MLPLLKKLFLGITLRERLLLTGFLWVGVLIWLLTNFSSWKQTSTELSNTSSSMDSNEAIIAQESTIDQKLAVAKADVDPTKTYTSTRLVEELEFITTLVKGTSEIRDFNYKTGKINTEKKSIFNVHSLRVSVTNARLADLVYFDELLQDRSPYIVMSKVTISNNRSDYRLCSADFEISSFELLDQMQEVSKTPPKRTR